MVYQSPERYVWDFVESITRELEIEKEVFKEIKVRGLTFKADFGVGGIVIEAEAPGGIEKGRDQIKKYMEQYGFSIGLLLDIPVERYYVEYPKPYIGPVGFEVYVRTALGIQNAYRREFKKGELDKARDELKLWLTVLRSTEIAKRPPDISSVLSKVQLLVKRYANELEKLLKDEQGLRVKLYFDMWKKNMGLIYGQRVIESLGTELTKLFSMLTVYVSFLKVLGITLLESLQGMGKYSTPYLLAGYGSKTSKTFWNRSGIPGVIFERDEYDWVFDPNIAPTLDDFLKDLGKALLEFDWSKNIPADLLKRVYQNIVPREVRRSLGEYYTPDWLAKLILYRALHMLICGSPPSSLLPKDIDEAIREFIDVFYKEKNAIPSFIDPTCGSFTFGVQYLSALADWYYTRKPNIHPIEFAKMVLSNVVGIDLNPVATTTAKVNYLLQIHWLVTRRTEAGVYFVDMPTIPILRADLTLLYEIGEGVRGRYTRSLLYYAKDDRIDIRIPIELLADDSIRKIFMDCGVKCVELKTGRDEGKLYYIEFSLPRRLLESLNITELHRVFIALTKGIDEVENELRSKLNKLEKHERDMLEKASKSIECLENKGVNSYVLSVIMGAFLLAHLQRKRFDLVVGNLPWVNISVFPKEYRERVKVIMSKLGISPPKEVLGKADISAPLLVLASEYLARDGAVVALMVPASLFRGLHGATWRRYISENLVLHEIWDLENVEPFEGASNQPGIVFASKLGGKVRPGGV